MVVLVDDVLERGIRVGRDSPTIVESHGGPEDKGPGIGHGTSTLEVENDAGQRSRGSRPTRHRAMPTQV
jgi:hypothetical protein